MREINFRAFDVYYKKMRYDVTGLECFPDTLVSVVFLNGESYSISSDKSERPAKLMQYTGLKDKNGEKIFEGDILQVDEYFDEDLESNLKKIGLVFFENGEGKFKEVGYFIEIMLFRDGKFWRKDECELRKARWDEFGNYNTQPITGWKIVGNKFENPELLEVM